MQANMGTIDRVVRVALAFVFGMLIIGGQVSGFWAILLGVLAVVFVGTSAIGFCPLYAPFRFSTKR